MESVVAPPAVSASGLRIADASVFPTLTATNPVVTVMMVAERAADLIRTQPSSGAEFLGA